MNISVSRSLLADTLRKVQGLASGKSAMPILANVKIVAEGDKASFTTTDLDVSIVMEMPCKVQSKGAITLPAKLLCDAIARAAEGDVLIEANDADCKATIRAGSSVFRLSGRPATEFPRLPVNEGSETKTFSIPQDTLKSLFRRTAYAMSKDETRRTLRGIYMKFADGALTLVATDGRRLALSEYHPETPYSFDMSFVLPEKTILEMTKLLGSSGNIVFSQYGTQMVAKFDNGVVLYSKLMDDAYPNYAAVIPKENDKEILIDRTALISAIERVGIFSEANSMKFEIANNAIRLSSFTPDSGSSDEPVPVKYDGEPIVANFNHNFILDMLKSLDDDEVTFLFKDGVTPLLVKNSGSGLAIVMPLRLC